MRAENPCPSRHERPISSREKRNSQNDEGVRTMRDARNDRAHGERKRDCFVPARKRRMLLSCGLQKEEKQQQRRRKISGVGFWVWVGWRKSQQQSKREERTKRLRQRKISSENARSREVVWQSPMRGRHLPKNVMISKVWGLGRRRRDSAKETKPCKEGNIDGLLSGRGNRGESGRLS